MNSRQRDVVVALGFKAVPQPRPGELTHGVLTFTPSHINGEPYCVPCKRTVRSPARHFNRHHRHEQFIVDDVEFALGP